MHLYEQEINFTAGGGGKLPRPTTRAQAHQSWTRVSPNPPPHSVLLTDRFAEEMQLERLEVANGESAHKCWQELIGDQRMTLKQAEKIRQFNETVGNRQRSRHHCARLARAGRNACAARCSGGFGGGARSRTADPAGAYGGSGNSGSSFASIVCMVGRARLTLAIANTLSIQNPALGSNWNSPGLAKVAGAGGIGAGVAREKLQPLQVGCRMAHIFHTKGSGREARATSWSGGPPSTRCASCFGSARSERRSGVPGAPPFTAGRRGLAPDLRRRLEQLSRRVELAGTIIAGTNLAVWAQL